MEHTRNRLTYKGPWHFDVKKEFVLNPGVSIGAKMLYIAIRSFCAADGDTAFPSSELLSKALKISRETVFKYAAELKKLGLMWSEQSHEEEGETKGRFSHTIYTLYEDIGDAQKDPSRKKPCTEKAVTAKSDTKSHHGTKEESPYLNSAPAFETLHQESKSKFNKPTIDDMIAHGKSMEPPLPMLESTACFNYYESNGWRVGRNPMKDWKSAMCNWRKGYLERVDRSKTNFSYKPASRGPATAMFVPN